MIDEHDKQDWRSVMVSQYAIFGSIAGLEVAALSIFATLSKQSMLFIEKFFFSLTVIPLLVAIPLILWLINEERKVAFNDGDTRWFRANEKKFRHILIWTMVISWILLLSLLVSVVWLTNPTK